MSLTLTNQSAETFAQKRKKGFVLFPLKGMFDYYSMKAVKV